MKNYKILSAVLFVFVAASCQKENFDGDYVPTTKPQMTIRAGVEQQVEENANTESTKSSLDPTGRKVLWSSGDKLAVFGSDALTVKAEYTLISETGKESGKFRGDAVEGDELIAVYPSSTVKGNVSISKGAYSIPVTIPATQTIVPGNIANNSNLAVAVGSGDNIRFKNVMGILKLRLYNPSGNVLTIKGLQIAAAEPLAGDAIITCSENEDPELIFTGDTTNVISLTLSKPANISTDESNPTIYYAVVPAKTMAKGFTVALETTYRMLITATTNNNTVHRNTIKSMPVKGIGTYKNKSELANTYIVKKNGSITVFPFRNDGVLIGHVKLGGYSSLGATSESAKGAITKYKDAYFKYTASANSGAEYVKAEDANGNVLWSWMLWTVDSDITDIALSDEKTLIMDRNLGAKTGVKTDGVTKNDLRGLYFQWGRKDPVSMSSSYSTITTSELVTLEYINKNPLKFVKPNAGTKYTNDWLWGGNNGLWCNNDGTKTIYDPCPAGYQIPATDNTSFWVNCNFAGKKGTYDSNLVGYPFKVGKNGEEIFLIGGYVYISNGKLAISSSGSYSGYSLPTNNNCGVFLFNDTEIKMSNQPRYYARQIRCQKQ